MDEKRAKEKTEPQLNDDETVAAVGDDGGTGAETQLKAELNKLKNDYLYLAAEFENYKKHAVKERSDLRKYANEALAREILEVADNFERALSSEVTTENMQSFKEGVSMIHREIQALLSRFHIQEVKSEGVVFDPSTHEALTSEETTEMEPGSVLRVFKKAYRLHDRLLRPAQVVVARAPSKEGQGV